MHAFLRRAIFLPELPERGAGAGAMNVCCRPVGCPETWPGLGSLRRRAWRVPHPPRQAILPVKMSEPLPNRGACHFLMPGVQGLAEGMRVSGVPHCGGWLRAGTRRRLLARLRVPWENQTLHRLAKAAGNLTIYWDRPLSDPFLRQPLSGRPVWKRDFFSATVASRPSERGIGSVPAHIAPVATAPTQNRQHTGKTCPLTPACPSEIMSPG